MPWFGFCYYLFLFEEFIKRYGGKKGRINIEAFQHISSPSDSEFESIKKYISEFELDDRDLKKEQFLIVKKENEILAFCRIRKHNGCDEMCSLGVIDKERGKGYAKLLIKEAIKTSTQPLYLACIIPEMFIPMGFKIVTTYPPELLDKLNYCTNELVVPEEYVVMKYSK